MRKAKVCALYAAIFLAACGRSSLSDTEREQLQECAEVLPMIVNVEVEPQRRMTYLMDGCGDALGFDKIVQASPAERNSLLAKTDILCSIEVSRAIAELPSMRSKLQRAVELCPPGYYGLPKTQSNYMSLDWFEIQRVGAWIRQTLKKADKSKDAELIQRTKDGLATFRAPLPIVPSVHKIVLPQAIRTHDVSSDVYIVVTPENSTAYSFPYVTLTPEGKAVLHKESIQPMDGEVSLKRVQQRIDTVPSNIGTNTVREISQPSSPPILLADLNLSAQAVLTIVDRLSESGAQLAVNEDEVTALSFGKVKGKSSKVKNVRAFVSLNDNHIALWKNGNMYTIGNVPAGTGRGTQKLNTLLYDFCPVTAPAGSACNGGYDWDTLFSYFGSSDTPKGVLLVAAEPKASYEALIKLFEIADLLNFEVATTGIDQAHFASQNLPRPSPDLK